VWTAVTREATPSHLRHLEFIDPAVVKAWVGMGLSLSREAERLSSLANDMSVGTIRPSEQSAAPQRRVWSAGVQLNL
jgi:hypothetical protein